MSTAHLNFVAADAASSTVNNVKQLVVQTVQWLGRQVQWLAHVVKDFFKNVIAYIKPFFSNVSNFVAKNFEKCWSLILANKEISIAAGIAIPVTIMAIIAALSLRKGNDAESTPQSFI